jgi:hypothetical protein
LKFLLSLYASASCCRAVQVLLFSVAILSAEKEISNEKKIVPRHNNYAIRATVRVFLVAQTECGDAARKRSMHSWHRTVE